MRKIAMFLVCIMLVTSCLLVFPIKNVQAGFGVSPPSISEYHLLPGSHYETIIYLVQDNPSNLTYCDVTINASEFQDWITIDPGFYFPFNVSQFPFGVIIDVPENASIGNYYGTMAIRKIVLNQEGQIVLIIGVQVTIHLTVIDYNYTYYEVVGAATPDHHIGEPMNVHLTIDNQGNTYTTPQYFIVDTYDISNTQLLETHNLTNWTLVAPFTRTTIINQCQSNLPCGQYWNHVHGYNTTTWLVFMGIYPFPLLYNPIPQNGSTMIPTNTTLSWSCVGPPNCDWCLTYDVYFGCVNPPPRIIGNQSENSFVPILDCSTTYYWKIIAWDFLGANCIGPVWCFTTLSPNEPPYAPSDPYPPNNATDIPLTADLNWTGGDPNEWDTVTYDVYFGTSSNPPLQMNNQSGTAYNLGTLSYLTMYYWKIVAWDSYGEHTIGSVWSFTTKANNLPVFGAPAPANGSTGNPLSFTWSIPINDPEGDSFSWAIQCSNGQKNNGTSASNGTKTLSLSGLTYSTIYNVWVNATDPTGSGLYTRRWYIFTTKANQPPSFPIITGPANGKIKVAIGYNFTSTDPDNDELYYFIEWGDTTNSSWIGPFNSGEQIIQSHTWSKKGTYVIKAKAKDMYGAESDWGTLTVTMPFSYEPQHPFISWLLNRFPNAFPLLRHIMGY